MNIFNYMKKVFIEIDDEYLEELGGYPLLRINGKWYLEGITYFIRILGINIYDITSSIEDDDIYVYIYFDKFISIDKLLEISSEGNVGVTSYFDNVNDINRELMCYKIKI